MKMLSRLDPRWDATDEPERRMWVFASVLLMAVGVLYVISLVTAPAGLALLLWSVYLVSAVSLVGLRYSRFAILVPTVAAGIWVIALLAARAL